MFQLLRITQPTDNNKPCEIPLSGVWGGRIYINLTTTHGGREVVFERSLGQVHHTQVKEEENNEERNNYTINNI